MVLDGISGVRRKLQEEEAPHTSQPRQVVLSVLKEESYFKIFLSKVAGMLVLVELAVLPTLVGSSGKSCCGCPCGAEGWRGWQLCWGGPQAGAGPLLPQTLGHFLA